MSRVKHERLMHFTNKKLHPLATVAHCKQNINLVASLEVKKRKKREGERVRWQKENKQGERETTGLGMGTVTVKPTV